MTVKPSSPHLGMDADLYNRLTAYLYSIGDVESLILMNDVKNVFGASAIRRADVEWGVHYVSPGGGEYTIGPMPEELCFKMMEQSPPVSGGTDTLVWRIKPEWVEYG